MRAYAYECFSQYLNAMQIIFDPYTFSLNVFGGCKAGLEESKLSGMWFPCLYNPNTPEVDPEFESSLGYMMVRPCLKRKRKLQEPKYKDYVNIS